MNIKETDKNLVNNSYFLETYFNGYMHNPAGVFIPKSLLAYETQNEQINEFVKLNEKTMLYKIENDDDLVLSLYTLSNDFEYKHILMELKKHLNDDDYQYIKEFNEHILDSKQSEIMEISNEQR